MKHHNKNIENMKKVGYIKRYKDMTGLWPAGSDQCRAT